MQKFKRNSLIAIISPLLVMSMASCERNGEQTDSSIDMSISSSEMEVTAIEIEGKSTVGVREYITLAAMANQKEQKVKWSSSNNSVATVSSTGVVKGVSKGTATITASLKTDESITDSFEVTVEDSRQISKVMDRFVNAKYYQVNGTGNIATSTVTGSFAFNEEHFNDSYLFSSSDAVCLPTYGLGVFGKHGTYIYNVENSQVTSATYLRTVYDDLNDVIIDITDMQYFTSSLTNISLADDGVYEITNTSLMAIFFYIWSQNFNITNEEYETLQKDLAKEMTSLTLTIISPYEFKATLNFDNLVTNAVLTFSNLNEDKTNTILSTYLKTNEIAYPETYSDITKIKELASSHNYYRDLGTYTKDNGTKFHIGRTYFTEDYVYFDYEDAYIEEVKDTNPVIDHGYINISGKKDYKDGVYEFTYKEDSNGEKRVFLGARWTDLDYQGYPYLHWYDLYENLSLVLDYFKGYEYTFSATEIDDATDYPKSKFNMYVSTCYGAQSACYEAFYDYIKGLNGSPEGLIFAIHLDEDNPENTVINYAGYISVSGSYGYAFTNYNYTGFGKGDVELLDNYLTSLENE